MLDRILSTSGKVYFTVVGKNILGKHTYLKPQSSLLKVCLKLRLHSLYQWFVYACNI